MREGRTVCVWMSSCCNANGQGRGPVTFWRKKKQCTQSSFFCCKTILKIFLLICWSTRTPKKQTNKILYTSHMPTHFLNSKIKEKNNVSSVWQTISHWWQTDNWHLHPDTKTYSCSMFIGEVCLLYAAKANQLHILRTNWKKYIYWRGQ